MATDGEPRGSENSEPANKAGLREHVAQKIGKEREYLTFHPVPSPVEDNIRLGAALILGDKKRVEQLESERAEHRESILTQLPQTAEAIGYIRKTLGSSTKNDLSGMMQDLRTKCGLEGYALKMSQTYAFDFYKRPGNGHFTTEKFVSTLVP